MRACLSATLASAATAFLMIASPSTASALSIGMNLQGDNNNPNYRYNRVELSGNASANQGGPAYTYSHSTRDGEDLHSYDLLYNIDVSGLSLSLNGDVQDMSQFNGYLHFHYTVGKAARYSPFSGSFSNYFNQEYAYYQFGLASKTKGENGRYFDVTAAGSKVELGDPAFQSLRNFEVNQNNADEFFIMNLVDLINQANPDQYSILELSGRNPAFPGDFVWFGHVLLKRYYRIRLRIEWRGNILLRGRSSASCDCVSAARRHWRTWFRRQAAAQAGLIPSV